MTKDEIEELINEKIEEKLYQLGIVKTKIHKKEQNSIVVNNYPQRYMRDSWYND